MTAEEVGIRLDGYPDDTDWDGGRFAVTALVAALLAAIVGWVVF